MKQFIEAKTRRQATRIAPWAAEVIKCEGGYMAFEYVSDADTWRNQK